MPAPRPAAVALLIASLFGAWAPARAQQLDVPPVVPFPKTQPLPPGADAPAPSPGAGPEGQGAFCDADRTVRLVVRNVSPGLAAIDPRAQPRTIYRRGTSQLRVEEQPDMARNGSKSLFLITEPHVWTIDVGQRAGVHSMDPGPIFEAHAPILPASPQVAPAFRGLEYGCEAAFVAATAPQPQRTIAWGEIQATVHGVTAGDQSLAILMDARRQTPLMISYIVQGKPKVVVRYDEYRGDLPDRPELFLPGKGLRITEAPPPPKRSGPSDGRSPPPEKGRPL